MSSTVYETGNGPDLNISSKKMEDLALNTINSPK